MRSGDTTPPINEVVPPTTHTSFKAPDGKPIRLLVLSAIGKKSEAIKMAEDHAR